VHIDLPAGSGGRPTSVGPPGDSAVHGRRNGYPAPAREKTVILEAAVLNVKPGEESAFEAAFGEAKGIISSMPGFIALELQRSVESRGRYLLLVRWTTLEHHTAGFRSSPGYQRWKALLHHFYDPFPTVEHYEAVHAA
jgi:heme-degrading monooxygenase HmoA